MGNDLRERLEALSASATPGPWFVTELPWFNSADGIVAGSPDGNICAPVADFENMGAGYEYHHQGSAFSIGDKYDARADTQFVVELINAWRDGTIVTRSEMEEAVAKAVSEEREAIQTEIIDRYAGGALHAPIGWPAEEKEHWQTGGLDHLTAVASAIRARSEQKEGK